MSSPIYLVVDVGTGSVRAAAVDKSGQILAFANREHEQHVPRYGWCEQRPSDWWDGACESILGVLAKLGSLSKDIRAIACCGQMHGTVLIDESGEPTREFVPLWNDKRTIDLVNRYQEDFGLDSCLKNTANPPTPAWPGFKLQWFSKHEPQLLENSWKVLMPKDFINFRLTGEIAFDTTEASASFLMDADSKTWSDAMIQQLGIPKRLLPPLRDPLDILGSITAKAARETGLTEGTPVVVSGGDFPVTLVGSGITEPGLGSDVTGTSSIITLANSEPVRHEEVCNVLIPGNHWGAFSLLDAGGDAVRWAKRAMNENTLSYQEATQKAEQSPAGSRQLFFLPYLTGERLGATRNSRAQFFGLNSGHSLADLHRSVLEGVAFAVRRHIEQMSHADNQAERIIAASGGAKSELWLKIKASMYNTPILVPKEPECGVIGCAAIAATATGQFDSLSQAARQLVQFEKEIAPDPSWKARYDRMYPVFNQIKDATSGLYTALDQLEED
ncbi:pentose kinase [Vibrio nigripulchritudo]|uniref:xylulokinase n=1 Tax=Vibrio nigripulchritudo TaxID=28173 RepID=UPI00190D177D|nr:FGGY family carbohydrate kinase [Vibrio nigripulchritudo]BCL73323.1 pentose kinase [Vibrio nigripulchritudo]BDU34689.1 pentose kinase [Vibrio nigripulchritudo]